MKAATAALLVCVASLGVAHADDAAFDRLDDALTFSSSDGELRARVSGTLDLEGYQFSQPAIGLIDSSGSALFNPRLSTFVDAQLGSKLYFFAQARVDRGFDPGNDEVQARLDEVALRLTPWLDGRLSLQAGKFATVVGNWVSRHGSWDNPFVNAPLVYENQTAVWDAVAAPSVATLLGWAHLRPVPAKPEPATDKYLRLPMIWGPSYANGFAVSGELGRFTYAAEAKSSALSSRPSQWGSSFFSAHDPTVSGRLGFRPNMAWSFGISASDGVYLQREAAATLLPGRSLSEYRERVFGQDIGFAWHHLQVWAEAYEARFAMPGVGDAKTFSYYVETRYKFSPLWFGALRWNDQTFSRLPSPDGGEVKWGADTWRVDLAVGHRFSAHTELKVQYSLQHHAPAPRVMGHVVSMQFVLRF